MLLRALGKFSKKISRKNLYEFIQQELAASDNNLKLLNIGSGGDIGAIISRVARLKNIQVMSLDISGDRNPDIIGDICKVDFSEEFDIVIASEVLEHVSAPKEAVSNIYKSLKPGGKLILTTPFIFPLHDIPYDYWRFTRYGLILLLEDAGFKVMNLRERNGWGEAITVLLSRPVYTPGFNLILKLISGILAVAFYPIGLLLSSFSPNQSLTTGYAASALKPKK